MAYVINRWNGAILTTVEDGTVDQTLDIKLIGKNYAGYGEIQNESFVHLLENFASSSPPPNAISGQVWFDTQSKRLKFFAGEQVSGQKIWKTAGGVEYGAEPLNPAAGDVWYDTANNQLKVRTALAWQLIGPPSVGDTLTQMVSRSVKDTAGNARPIMVATVNDIPVYIVSSAEFDIDVTDLDSQITGFSVAPNNKIKKGLTLAFVNANGVSSNQHVYWGTSSNALMLDGISASSYVKAGSVFTDLIAFGDVGYTVGNDADLKVYIENGSTPIIRNQTGSDIVFRVQDGSNNTRNPVNINSGGVEPGVTETFTLGTALKKWNTVYAVTFNGNATTATLANNIVGQANSATISSTSANTVSTIVARDASGNFSAGTITASLSGNASSASKLQTARTISLGGDLSGSANFDGTGNITISASLTSSVAGDVGSATSSNIANTIVKRDASGNFSAGTINANLSGNASTATKLQTARTIAISGAVSGSATFDGSGNVTITTSGGGLTSLTAGTDISVSGSTISVVSATAATANSIAKRDGSGNLTANIFNGTATAARYADLAEKYLADEDYPVGTVVCVGGEKEVTAAKCGDLAIGVVSENPAYMMNKDLEGGTYIALKGRVPVRVVGTVKKGQYLEAWVNGKAAVAAPGSLTVFGVALEDSETGLVEAVIL